MIIMNKKFVSKHFDSKREANTFAQEVRGIIEGPFYDFDANTEYIVFYYADREQKFD